MAAIYLVLKASIYYIPWWINFNQLINKLIFCGINEIARSISISSLTDMQLDNNITNYPSTH